MQTEQVLAPVSVDELREAVCGIEGPLRISGGGTSMGFANPGGPFAATVSTRSMNRVLHYEPADLTIAVEAGATIAEVTRVLGEHNQHLPFDVAHPERATVGGVFAAGLGGPRRLRYLWLKDWTLGIEVMGPDGVLTKSGGMVVKNVTGYDLPRLHHSAHGAFGIVTRVNLKVIPQEEASRSIVVRFDSLSEATAAAIAVLGSYFEPASVLLTWDGGWSVQVSCDGPLVSVDGQAGAILDTASAAATPTDSTITESAEAAIAPYLAVADLNSKNAVARLSVPASRQQACLEQLSQLADTAAVGDLGSGLIYVSGPATLEWRDAVLAVTQATTFLNLPDDLKAGIDVFGSLDPISGRLVRGLKAEFDPSGKLNRGRFVLGI